VVSSSQREPNFEVAPGEKREFAEWSSRQVSEKWERVGLRQTWGEDSSHTLTLSTYACLGYSNRNIAFEQVVDRYTSSFVLGHHLEYMYVSQSRVGWDMKSSGGRSTAVDHFQHNIEGEMKHVNVSITLILQIQTHFNFKSTLNLHTYMKIHSSERSTKQITCTGRRKSLRVNFCEVIE
jgi:hypothetical protein